MLNSFAYAWLEATRPVHYLIALLIVILVDVIVGGALLALIRCIWEECRKSPMSDSIRTKLNWTVFVIVAFVAFWGYDNYRIYRARKMIQNDPLVEAIWIDYRDHAQAASHDLKNIKEHLRK